MRLLADRALPPHAILLRWVFSDIPYLRLLADQASHLYRCWRWCRIVSSSYLSCALSVRVVIIPFHHLWSHQRMLSHFSCSQGPGYHSDAMEGCHRLCLGCTQLKQQRIAGKKKNPSSHLYSLHSRYQPNACKPVNFVFKALFILLFMINEEELKRGGFLSIF